jgi:ABC-type transport system substrate-binding protein
MSEIERTMSRTGRRPTRRAIAGLAATGAFAASLALGCGSQPASPSAASASAPAATPAGTAVVASARAGPTAAPATTPAPAYADTLRIGWPPNGTFAGYRLALDGVSAYLLTLGSVAYSRLYRYDARYNAIPDLADGPCVPQGDGTVLRCRIVETTFHDGTPLTADDVAYSYRLLGRDAFSGGVAGGSWTGDLKEVRIVDERTVDFVLPSVDTSFLTVILARVPILPRHVVEAQYAAFVAATKDLTATELTSLADAIDEETGRDPPVCTPRLDAVTALVEKMGVRLYREDFLDATGTLDACYYVGASSWFIRLAASARAADGIDAVAAAYELLPITRRPVGSGPYRVVSEDAGGIHLEAWPGYHGGLAATRYLDFVPTRADGAAVMDGSVDIAQLDSSQLGDVGPGIQAIADSRGVRVGSTPEQDFFALQFNVRSGRLFADVDLRRALQLCIDVPRVVDAATGGAATAIYGPVMVGSWAYDPTIPKPTRDAVAARALIEGAGWRTGPDGVYEKGGTHLAAGIVVRGDDPTRVKAADLIAHQARDCGMDLHGQPLDWGDIVSGLLVYPHDIPGTTTPFDLCIGGWLTEPDPAVPFSGFVSSAISDAAHPDGRAANPNWIGFSDPVLDRLVEAAHTTYDQAERARLYRQAQQELAAQLPYIFLWSRNAADLVRSEVSTVDGPLDLTAPNWAWQPGRLVVEKAVS